MSNLGVKKNSTFKYEAPVAGASGGTLLVLLANNLPDNYAYKSWLILIAPTISVALSAFWVWSKIRVDAYIGDRKTERILKELRTEIENDLKNPHTSEEHKKLLKAQLEKFEKLRIESLAAKAKFEIIIENE